MAIRIVFRDPQADKQWRDQMTAKVRRIARASTEGARAAARDIEQQGRANIASAGRFGKRWQSGLKAIVWPSQGYAINSRIDVTHDMPGAGLFEFGGSVKGRPLWLPLSFANVKGRARDVGRREGLFRVERMGKPPLLMSMKTKLPLFVGIEQVTIPRKWRIRDIGRAIISNFVSYYNRYLRD